MYKEMFGSMMVIILMFNGFMLLVNPTNVTIFNSFSDGDFSGIIITALIAFIAVAGISLGTETEMMRVVFIVVLISAILFNITIDSSPVYISVGLGLMSNITNIFQPTDIWGLPYIMVAIFSIFTYFCAIMMITEEI